uniref:Glycosyltransferase 2-like domain-containing protein n=1 Tax=Aplanochytrium stocchinoi TaxID=215587 RepID=A0A7S3PCT3_9STRA|mmetsp:Transcript_82/g.137  ORF Transcript_82/g.137 Transcript_82/m.137 type:complete len:216 (-) Transcript_82:711-1358(-)
MCQKKYDLVIISMAFYPDMEAKRVDCARKTCAAVHQLASTSNDYSVHMVIINDENSHPFIKGELQQHGNESLTVVAQKNPGMKGIALREAISFAQNICAQSGVIAFLELEKSNFISHAKTCATPILRNEADIVIPRRSDPFFASTYAKEQYHSETFGNMYINNLLNRQGDAFLDIYFGPFLFSRKLATLWLAYEGNQNPWLQFIAILVKLKHVYF